MAKPIRLRTFRGLDGRWWWNATAGNNKIVDASEQGYALRWYARRKARRSYPDGIFVQ